MSCETEHRFSPLEIFRAKRYADVKLSPDVIERNAALKRALDSTIAAQWCRLSADEKLQYLNHANQLALVHIGKNRGYDNMKRVLRESECFKAIRLDFDIDRSECVLMFKLWAIMYIFDSYAKFYLIYIVFIFLQFQAWFMFPLGSRLWLLCLNRFMDMVLGSIRFRGMVIVSIRFRAMDTMSIRFKAMVTVSRRFRSMVLGFMGLVT